MLAQTCTLVAAFALALSLPTTHAAGGPACAQENLQCGSDATGATCCPAGYYCQPWNAAYYQCIPVFPQCQEQRVNLDFQGDDLATYETSQPGACCAACAANPQCVAYTYVNNQPGKPGCYLKKAMSKPVTKVGAVSGIVSGRGSPPPPGQCKQTLANTDFNGADIKNVNAASVGDCCAKCNADSRCQTFSFKDTTCYLKSGEGSKQSTNGVTSGYADRYNGNSNPNPGPSGKCMEPMQGVDFNGDDLKKYSSDKGTVQASDCCNQCAQESGCVAYTLADNVCYLKKGFGKRQGKNGATSGIVIPAHCVNPVANTDYAGNDFRNFGGTTLGACCDACAKDPACKAYTFWDNTCYLKNGQGSAQKKDGAISGVKGGSSSNKHKVYHFRILG